MKKSPMKNMAYWKSKNGITPLKQDDEEESTGKKVGKGIMSSLVGGLEKMEEERARQLASQQNIENPNRGT